MMKNERQIASLFGILGGVLLLLWLPGMLDSEQETEHRHLNYPEQFCEDVKLGNPGGMTFNTAMVCVNGEFEIVTNTGHLTDEKYNELIQPVLDSLHNEARKAGINTQGINGYVR